MLKNVTIVVLVYNKNYFFSMNGVLVVLFFYHMVHVFITS